MSPVDKQQEFLGTDHLRAEIERRTARGGVVTIGAQMAAALIDLTGTVVLARLLVPADFGLLGMVVAITGFLGLFKDMGLSMATVQREDISHAQVSNLFWINIAASIVLMMATASLAPVIAWFYDDSKLIPITLALAVGFLFSGLSVQHLAILKRRMRLGALAATKVVSLLGSTALGIWLALNEYNYWALVAKSLCAILLIAIISWAFCRWRPSLPSKTAPMLELLAFGGNLTGFNLINYFARNLDDILIGRSSGAYQLGLYQKAYQLFMMPLKQLNQPLSSVAIPALSRLADQPDKYREMYFRILEKITLITMPLATFMFITADWIILLILGAQWVEATPILMALSIGILVQPIGFSTGWLFISQNRTQEMMKWGVIGSLIAMAAFVAGLPWGAVGVATFYSVSGLVIRTPLNLWYAGRKGPVTMMDIYRRTRPFALTAIASAASLLAMRVMMPTLDPATGLFAAISVTALATLLILLVIPSGRSALRDFRGILKLFRGTEGL